MAKRPQPPKAPLAKPAATAAASKPDADPGTTTLATVPLDTERNDAPAGSVGLQAGDLAAGASPDSTQAASPVIEPPVPSSAAVESAAGGPAILSDDVPAEGVVDQDTQPESKTGLIEPAEPGAPQASNQPTTETQAPEAGDQAAQGSGSGDESGNPKPPETAALPAVQYDVRPADPAKAAVVGGYYTPLPPNVRR